MPKKKPEVFGIAKSLAAEVMHQNDGAGRHNETPEDRWCRVRRWVAARIKEQLQ